MKKYKIAVIAGDGIGPEVIDEGIKVLNEIATLDGTSTLILRIFHGAVSITRSMEK